MNIATDVTVFSDHLNCNQRDRGHTTDGESKNKEASQPSDALAEELVPVHKWLEVIDGHGEALDQQECGAVPAAVMKRPLAHPTVEAVKAIHAEVLAAHGGGTGRREEVLLESAVAAPRATMMGEPLFTDPAEIATAYLFYLCRNRPFMDGNKRTSLATCLVFLSENDLLPDEKLDLEAWEALTVGVAASRLDRQQTTTRLRKLLRSQK